MTPDKAAFEAWAGNDFCLDLQNDGRYEVWRTDCAWDAWQAATKAERERIAAWIETQRNDIPASGAEFAAAIRAG